MFSTWRLIAGRPLQLVSLGGAVLWSIGLIAAAAIVPAYTSVSMSADGVTTSGSETLVGENGTRVLFMLAVPLAATLLVSSALLLSRKRWALRVAAVATGALALMNLAAMLTIGVFVLPVTGALVVACLCGVGIQGTPGEAALS